MKNSFLKFISLSLVFCVFFSFASCKKDPEVTPEEPEIETTRSTTQPVEIVEVPTGRDELTQMLNAAINYTELYCYHYTKNIDCKASDINVGSLSAASKAVDAFKSIFGEKNITMNYEYNASRDAFSANFPSGDFTVDEIETISAKRVDDKIIITAVFPNENNPSDDSGALYRLCPDYQNSEDVKKALIEFNSSASSISVSASDIMVEATLNANDSSLEQLAVSYTQRYTLSGVILSKLEGSTVTGTAKTRVVYSEIGT